MLSEYSRSTQVDVHALDVVCSSEIVKVDADHYHEILPGVSAQRSIKVCFSTANLGVEVPSEVWHQHDDPDPSLKLILVLQVWILNM